jgi:hypothetical protein
VVTTPESYSGGLGLETGCPDAEIIYWGRIRSRNIERQSEY